MRATSDVAIVTAGLTRRFGDRTAVADLGMEIPRGTVFGLLGPNGSGKTTTIRLLLGLLEPTAGSALVLGLDPVANGDEVRARCGVLLEHHGLYERLSAWDNLMLFGRFWRMDRARRHARAEELLSGIGLLERRHDIVGGWSRGMKQRLAIARALFHRPELVFLDEPSAGLDPIVAKELRSDIARLAAEEHVTVFLTTHNLAEAEKVCGLIGVMAHGSLRAFGPPASVANGRDIEDTFTALVAQES